MSENEPETKEPLFEDYLGFTDDGQQVLVTVWYGGNATVSFREDKWAVWSKPVRCQKVGS